MQRLTRFVQRYPLVLVLGVALGVWLYATWGGTESPAVASYRERQQVLPQMPVTKALQAKDLLDSQQKTVELERDVKELKRALLQQTQGQEQKDREREQREAGQRQAFEAQLQARLDAQTAKLTEQLKATKQEVKPVVKPVVKPQHPMTVPQSTPPARPAAILEMKGSMDTSHPFASGGAPLPDAARADTAYLPAGSFAEVKLISGVFATSRAGWSRDLFVSIAQPFHPPRRLGGPDQPSSPTEVDLSGCYLIGMAEGDLASGRVYATMHTLSCVLPTLTTVEQPMKGILLGVDGTLGLVGRVEMRDTAYLGRMALTSLMSGAAEAFALSKRQVITTPFGGTTSVTTGSAGEFAGYSALAKATADLSQFYRQQAERLLPTLWVESGARGKVIIKEGLTLEEYPTKVLLARGGAR